MKYSAAFLVSVLIALSIVEARAQHHNKSGVELDKSYTAKADSSKRIQLFQAINAIRVVKDLRPLNYRIQDQALADMRAMSISQEFVADTLDCTAEVIYRGTLEEVCILALDSSSNENHHYLADMVSASIGFFRRQDGFYAVIRVFSY